MKLIFAQLWLLLALAGNVATVVSAERLRTAQTGRRNYTGDPNAAQGAVSRLRVADADVATVTAGALHWPLALANLKPVVHDLPRDVGSKIPRVRHVHRGVGDQPQSAVLDGSSTARRGEDDADPHLLPTLVSYSFYYEPADKETCRSNLDFFLRHGVSKAGDVKFVIHVIGHTPVPASLASLAASASNVQMRRVRNCGADLCTHGQFVQSMPAKEREGFGGFIFLNCGSRGPYQLKSLATPWYGRFREAMRGDLALVGPTVSCSPRKHVQSYVVGASPGLVGLLVRRWRPERDSHQDYIDVGELGLSKEVLEKGGRLTALGLDGCTYGDHNPFTCDHFVTNTTTDKHRLCRERPASLAVELEPSIECQDCQRLEPTRVIFIKNGGSAERSDTRSPAVLARAQYLEMSGLLTEYDLPVANSQGALAAWGKPTPRARWPLPERTTMRGMAEIDQPLANGQESESDGSVEETSAGSLSALARAHDHARPRLVADFEKPLANRIESDGSAEETSTRSLSAVTGSRDHERPWPLSEFDPLVASGPRLDDVEPPSQHLEKAEAKENLGHFEEASDRVARKPTHI